MCSALINALVAHAVHRDCDPTITPRHPTTAPHCTMAFNLKASEMTAVDVEGFFMTERSVTIVRCHVKSQWSSCSPPRCTSKRFTGGAHSATAASALCTQRE